MIEAADVMKYKYAAFKREGRKKWLEVLIINRKNIWINRNTERKPKLIQFDKHPNCRQWNYDL